MTTVLLLLSMAALAYALGMPKPGLLRRASVVQSIDPPVIMEDLRKRPQNRPEPRELGQVWMTQSDGFLRLEADENPGALFTIQAELESRDAQLSTPSRSFHVIFLQAPQGFDLISHLSRKGQPFDPPAFEALGVRKLLSREVGKVQARPVARTGQIHVSDTRFDLPELISDIPMEHLRLQLSQREKGLVIESLQILEDFNDNPSEETAEDFLSADPEFSPSVFAQQGLGTVGIAAE
ncbi:MAG: hypothetical protein N4A70_17220 [Pelagimonas sp.]|nr:hypothetical protein [Pelagimonas sp.]